MSKWVSAAYTTLHCMIGCVIGELIGLLIGVYFQLGVATTISLTFFFAYLIGFALGIIPLIKRENLSIKESFKVIWLGEFISITVMEIIMNFIDYHYGGIQVSSIENPLFWKGLIISTPFGFLAAWPVNYLMLKFHLKNKCH